MTTTAPFGPASASARLLAATGSTTGSTCPKYGSARSARSPAGRARAFDDSVGEVSGTWVTGRPPSSQPGLLIYIMVDSVAAVVDAVVSQGGEIVQPIGGDAPEITARFRDPAGNVIGLYQEPNR